MPLSNRMYIRPPGGGPRQAKNAKTTLGRDNRRSQFQEFYMARVKSVISNGQTKQEKHRKFLRFIAHTSMAVGDPHIWNAIGAKALQSMRGNARKSLTDAQCAAMVALVKTKFTIEATREQGGFKDQTPFQSMVKRLRELLKSNGDPMHENATDLDIVIEAFRSAPRKTIVDPSREDGTAIIRAFLQNPEGCSRLLLKLSKAAQTIKEEDLVIAFFSGGGEEVDVPSGQRWRFTDERIAHYLGDDVDAKKVQNRRISLGIRKAPEKRQKVPRGRRHQTTAGKGRSYDTQN